MQIENLLKENPTINLTVKAEELMEFGRSIADRALHAFLQKHDEKVYSRNEVIQKFGICEATLWRWEKLGFIKSKKIGNRKFFPESEVDKLYSTK